VDTVFLFPKKLSPSPPFFSSPFSYRSPPVILFFLHDAGQERSGGPPALTNHVRLSSFSFRIATRRVHQFSWPDCDELLFSLFLRGLDDLVRDLGSSE